jgi:putative membrane protein
MLNKIRTAIITIFSITALMSCDKDDDPTTEKYSAKDKEFMTKATYTNIGEINSGNLALQKATSQAVNNFASMMITDHTNAQTQLQNLAQPNGQILPSDTDQEHKDMTAMLSSLSGDAFDSTYMYMMVAGHDKAIALHQDEIQNGSDPDLKNFASEKILVIQHHRMMADSIAHALFP